MFIISNRSIKYWQKKITSWAKRKGFNWSKDDIDTILLRIHSEVSEASESSRDCEIGDPLGEELADIFIRLANCAEVMDIDLEEEVREKMKKNYKRGYLHNRGRK